MSTFADREEWLHRALETYMRPLFRQLGYRLPDVIHLSVGFPFGKKGTPGESKDIPGETWSGVHSGDNHPHVFISPFESDAIVVLETLLHECVHCYLDPDMSHDDGLGGNMADKPFRVIATAIGLVGHLDATRADGWLREIFAQMVGEPTTDPDGNTVGGELGPYPHPALMLLPSLAVNDPQAVVPATTGRAPRTTSGPAKQRNRWITVKCPKHPGAPTVHSTRTAILEGRAPLCGEPMLVFPDGTDVDGLEGLRAELVAAGERACGERMTAKVEGVSRDADEEEAS